MDRAVAHLRLGGGASGKRLRRGHGRDGAHGAARLPRWHPYYRLAVRLDGEPEEETGPQLGRLGISPGDVRALILTHLHTDHAGGLHHLPNTEIFVAEGKQGLARGFGGRLRGYLPNRWPGWFRPKPLVFDPTPFGPFERGLAGDVSYTEGLLLEEAVDGVSPDERAAPNTTRNVLRYARGNPTVYLPSHDPDS